MHLDGARQNPRFDITADRHKIVRGHGVGDSFSLLLDDRPFVEIGSCIERRGPDGLDPTFMCLAPLKLRRKE